MKKTIAAFIIILLALPSIVIAWEGKVVAIESADTFIILKDDNTPVKVRLAGVMPANNISSSKALLESSNLALMKNVDVRELSKSGDTTIGEITIDGESLTKNLLDAGVVQSQAAPTATVEINKPEPDSTEETVQTNNTVEQQNTKPSTEDILAELEGKSKDIEPESSTISRENSDKTYEVAPNDIKSDNSHTSPPQIRYVKVSQPQGLGFWPVRQTIVQTPENAAPPSLPQYSHSTQPAAIHRPEAEDKKMQEPGDIAKKDYDLAVRVQKNTRRQKNSGFLVPKKKSETYVGGAAGTQFKMEPSGKVPYSNFGAMGGATVRHFYPSGWGVGGDFTVSSTSGKSGSISNSTNSTYDYKSKSFNTYTLTGALLYRFYTDPHWTPYVALHGGYSLFSYPDTIFNISDGAPVLGGGAGIMYEFDSGLTIGTDMRYLKTLGTKSNDPDGFFDTTINFGFTFD